MTRGRLVALHALALTMTIATMTLVAVATSQHSVGPPVRWVVIAIGGLAAIASLAFARAALREIERLSERAAQLESRANHRVEPVVAEPITPGGQPRLLR